MQVLEKQIENKVVKWAKRRKIKLKKKERGELLDRWFMLPAGRLFIIEFKRPGGSIKKRQTKEIKELKELGYDVEIHDNSEEAIQAITSRLEATQVSDKGGKVHASKRMRRTLPRSRSRKN